MNKPLTDREKLAWEFAQDRHKNQIRKFLNLPYFDAHVQKVNGILKQHTKEEDKLIAALLHDTFEDTFENKWIGYSVVKGIFGMRVADLVMELTSDKDEILYKYDGSKLNYLKDKLSKMSDDALEIKLADRLQNISDAFTASDSFREKYYNETVSLIETVENRKLTKVSWRLVLDIKSKLENINKVINSQNI